MRGSPEFFRLFPQPAGAEGFFSTGEGLRIRIRPERPAVFRHKEQQEAVDQPQQLAVVILFVQFPAAQFLFEFMICRMLQKSGTQCLDGVGHPLTEFIQGAHAAVRGEFCPLFQQAVLKVFKAAFMTDQPEQTEIGKEITVKHGFQVEFEIGLAGKHHGIPQDAQLQPVGQDPPEAVFRAVQVFLQQGMRADAGSAGNTLRTAIQFQAEADLVDRHIPAAVGDGVALPAYGLRFAEREFSEAKFLKERCQPVLTGFRCPGGGLFPLFAESLPDGNQTGPGTVDRFINAFCAAEPVVLGFQAGQAVIQHSHAFEQVHRQQPAFAVN